MFAGCLGCFGPARSLDGEMRSLLADFGLSRCVKNARPTNNRLGESPYGFVDEVCC